MKRSSRIYQRVLTCSALIGMQIAASSAWCSIPHGLRSTLMRNWAFYPTRDFSKGFDIAAIKPVESARDVNGDDIGKLIPYGDMKETNNQGLVASQILDRSLSTWFNSEAVRHSDVGRTAHTVEKSMEGDVNFGGSEPDSIKHQLKFVMKATQTRAEVEYTGLTTAQVTYFILQEKTNLEIREPMKSLNTQLVFNNIVSKEERSQMVSLRWNW